MEVPELAAPAHSAVQEGGGAEATDTGRVGVKGGHLKGVQRLWKSPCDGDLLQIPGKSDFRGRWRLDGSGTESGKGKGSVVEDANYHQQGGGVAAGV